MAIENLSGISGIAISSVFAPLALVPFTVER
jgi:hypothetical protein